MPDTSTKVTLKLVNPFKNPHWTELAKGPFNNPETGKHFQIKFRVEGEHDIWVLVRKNENRTHPDVYVTGNVAFGEFVPGLGYCGPKENRMKFKIKYNYIDHTGELIIEYFGGR